MSEITSAKPVICDRCGEAIDFRIFPAAIHVVGEKNYHIGCVARVQDPRDAEIASLRAQLDEARRLGGKHILDASRQLKEKDDEIKTAADEARRKAIEECAAIADRWTSPEQRLHGHGGAGAEILALLSESKT